MGYYAANLMGLSFGEGKFADIVIVKIHPAWCQLYRAALFIQSDAFGKKTYLFARECTAFICDAVDLLYRILRRSQPVGEFPVIGKN